MEKVLQDDFDIVLMDMQMPIMDGYEASAKLRELNFDRPIVALTANVLADDIRRCLDSGCTELLVKRIDMDVLVQTLAELLVWIRISVSPRKNSSRPTRGTSRHPAIS